MNDDTIARGQRAMLLLGRTLLGIYFVLPGVQKIFAWDQMSAYMADHSVPLVPVLLALTIVIQIGAGGALIAGFKTQLMAFLLAGLTLVISIFMHNFWAMEDGLAQQHETQNFVKNLAIMAGLLYVAGCVPKPAAATEVT